MSGGHWNYQQFRLEALGDELGELLATVAKTEHIVDWAVCGDTSREDAQKELFKLWEDTFEKLYGD